MLADSFSIKEYARHQRQLHLDILAQQRGSKFTGTIKENSRRNSNNTEGSTGSSNADSESSESSEDDLNVDDYYFLQPVPTRQRRLMLRQAGIKKIDTLEKEECKDIRTSRESCGCDCRVYCEPETCACSLAGIKCQVDRLSFPCGCSKEGCGNHSGRIEFNPIRVRTHFIHTLMRLEMDKKQEEENELRAKRLQENGPTQAESSPVCPELVTDPDPPRVQTKQESETEDVTMYNSNERGSCCDCQNSDIHEFMMQESQFNANSNNANLQNPNPSAAEYMAGPSAVAGNAVEAPSSTQGNKAGENLPQVLLFNDSDDDYNGENSATIYPFNKEESSYSESSDCSSEASVSESDQNNTAGGFQSFPENPTFDTPVLESAQGGTFCMTPSSTTQPEQKFMDLSEPGSSYKLEPISEILNPVRFPGYGPGPNVAWGQCADNFQGYTCGEQANGNIPANSSFCATQAAKSQDYLFNVENGNTSVGDGLSCILPPSAELPEQYLEQDYENGNGDGPKSQAPTQAPKSINMNIQVNGDSQHQGACHAVPEKEEKSYHDLSNSTSTSQDHKSSATAPLHPQPVVSPDIAETKENGVMEDDETYPSLTEITPTSQKELTPQENPKSVQGDVNHYKDPSQPPLAKKCKLLHENGVTSSDKKCGKEEETVVPPCAKLNGAKGEEIINGVEAAESTSPKFGEIIKESIVETVSA